MKIYPLFFVALVAFLSLGTGCASLSPAPPPAVPSAGAFDAAILPTGPVPEPEPAASPQPPGYTRYAPPAPPARIEPPRGWFSMGFHWVGEQNDVGDVLRDSVAFSFGGGGFIIRHEQIGIGPEVEGSFSYHDARLAPNVSDDVYVSRFLLGGRFAWFVRDTNLAPYFRGGWMYRWDDGDFVRDDGGGFYLGGGLDIMVHPHFSISPQFLYTNSNLSVDAEEYLIGLNFDFKF
jgi:hypothetical protein